jgi:hypothetical protein
MKGISRRTEISFSSVEGNVYGSREDAEPWNGKQTSGKETGRLVKSTLQKQLGP